MCSHADLPAAHAEGTGPPRNERDLGGSQVLLATIQPWKASKTARRRKVIAWTSQCNPARVQGYSVRRNVDVRVVLGALGLGGGYYCTVLPWERGKPRVCVLADKGLLDAQGCTKGRTREYRAYRPPPPVRARNTDRGRAIWYASPASMDTVYLARFP